MAFLSDDYKVPTQSRYMKWNEGENRFRILGSFENGTAIMGYEYWVSRDGGGRMPVRVKMGTTIDTSKLEVDPKTGKKDLPSHFWALPVYNWMEDKIQILEIKQKTIMEAIKNLARNKKWGDPENYDITVNKNVDSGKVTYNVVPEPKEELPEEILKKISDTPINIKALFTGDDPFTEVTEDVDPDEIPEDLGTK